MLRASVAKRAWTRGSYVFHTVCPLKLKEDIFSLQQCGSMLLCFKPPLDHLSREEQRKKALETERTYLGALAETLNLESSICSQIFLKGC